MKTLIKILLSGFLIMILASQVHAQSVSLKSDSIQVAGKSVTIKSDNDKSSNSMVRQNGNSQNAAGSKSIKQVKGARPDMSRARSARPPSVVRQSGSGMPRGMGKPGGATRHGRR